MNSNVTVVIPTHNRCAYLEELLISISCQSVMPDKVIIINDASLDRRAYEELIERMSNKLEIEYFYFSESIGVQAARNFGLGKVKTEFVCFVDDDDSWCKGKLENQLSLTDDDADIVYSWVNLIDSSGAVIGNRRADVEGYPRKEILSACFIPSPTIMVKTKLIKEAGGFDEAFPSCQDWDMWTSIILKGAKVKLSKNYDANYRIHEGPSVGKSSKALLGYALYYKKYFGASLRFLNVAFVLSALKFFIKRPIYFFR